MITVCYQKGRFCNPYGIQELKQPFEKLKTDIMKQTFGIILIIAALALGYLGYDKMQNSKAGIKIGDLEISASNKTSSESAYLLLGLGAVCLLGGLVMITRSKS